MMALRLERELSNAIEIIKDRLYFVCLRLQPRPLANAHFFTIDQELIYESFFADFGPLNLGHVCTFCRLVDKKFVDPKLARKRIYLYTSFDPCKRTNAAFLIGAYQVLRMARSPEEAYAPFSYISPPFLPYRDAGVGISTFNVGILDTLKALYKAQALAFFDMENFNLQEYQFYEKVENGDLNWILPGKFIAFSGPLGSRFDEHGNRAFIPEDYVPYFKKNGVTAVVRLNKKEYDRNIFIQNGINHYDLYFIDGTAPSEEIMRKFLEIAETETGVICVHCKAGLGRTGTLIACYIMKHFRFTATEAIAYLRICRPGSVMGPQQHFLQEYQSWLWKAGELYKRRKAIISATPTLKNSFEEINGISNGLRVMSVNPSPPSPPPVSLNNSSTSTMVQSSSYSNASPSLYYPTATSHYNLRDRGRTSSMSTISSVSSSYPQPQVSNTTGMMSGSKLVRKSSVSGVRRTESRVPTLHLSTSTMTTTTLFTASAAPPSPANKIKTVPTARRFLVSPTPTRDKHGELTSPLTVNIDKRRTLR